TSGSTCSSAAYARTATPLSATTSFRPYASFGNGSRHRDHGSQRARRGRTRRSQKQGRGRDDGAARVVATVGFACACGARRAEGLPATAERTEPAIRRHIPGVAQSAVRATTAPSITGRRDLGPGDPVELVSRFSDSWVAGFEIELVTDDARRHVARTRPTSHSFGQHCYMRAPARSSGGGDSYAALAGHSFGSGGQAICLFGAS